MNFAFVYIYRHIYRKWVSLVDSKCRNTVILTGLTYASSRKVFHDGCAKRGIFSQQILNKNSLSLVHCALNRSFTVYIIDGKLKILETNQKSKEIMHFYLIFCVFMDFYCNVVKRNIDFGSGVLKRGIPELVRFCIGDLPMYTFLVPTHRYYLTYPI